MTAHVPPYLCQVETGPTVYGHAKARSMHGSQGGRCAGLNLTGQAPSQTNSKVAASPPQHAETGLRATVQGSYSPAQHSWEVVRHTELSFQVACAHRYRYPSGHQFYRVARSCEHAQRKRIAEHTFERLLDPFLSENVPSKMYKGESSRTPFSLSRTYMR